MNDSQAVLPTRQAAWLKDRLPAKPEGPQVALRRPSASLTDTAAMGEGHVVAL
jgi:hypothetical protein